MGIFGKKQIRKVCHKDKDTGEVKCNMSRVHKDGTETTLAGYTAQADADCKMVMTESFENEEGALTELERDTLPRIIGKCRKSEENMSQSNTPQDY